MSQEVLVGYQCRRGFQIEIVEESAERFGDIVRCKTIDRIEKFWLFPYCGTCELGEKHTVWDKETKRFIRDVVRVCLFRRGRT